MSDTERRSPERAPAPAGSPAARSPERRNPSPARRSRSPPRNRDHEGTKLFIGGLPWAVDDRELESTFSSFGEISFCRVITDRETGRSRGFGFVTFVNEDDALAAIDKMHDSDMEGRNITVNKARPLERGGGGGGGRYAPYSSRDRGGRGYGRDRDDRYDDRRDRYDDRRDRYDDRRDRYDDRRYDDRRDY